MQNLVETNRIRNERKIKTTGTSQSKQKLQTFQMTREKERKLWNKRQNQTYKNVIKILNTDTVYFDGKKTKFKQSTFILNLLFFFSFVYIVFRFAC